MTDVVIDANVAVKMVVVQEYTGRALQLLADTLASQGTLVSPPHLNSEVLSAIYRHYRSQDPRWHLNQTEAELALRRFLELPIERSAPDHLYQRAFEFARTHGLRSTYDSIYVVLAQILGVEMWTADQALIRAIGADAPWVRSLGDYPTSAA